MFHVKQCEKWFECGNVFEPHAPAQFPATASIARRPSLALQRMGYAPDTDFQAFGIAPAYLAISLSACEPISRQEHPPSMRAKSHLAKGAPIAGLVLLALFASLPCATHAQQATPPQRIVLAGPDRDTYLEDLVRNAPKAWPHGKNWVQISPYVLGRNITEPSVKTLCPDDAGFADARSSDTDILPIYSSADACNRLGATAEDSAALVLDDRKDPSPRSVIPGDLPRRRADLHMPLGVMRHDTVPFP